MQKYLLIANDCVFDAVGDIHETFVDKITEDNGMCKKQAV